jgi:F-type H+-transporting ATPase subunit b
MKRLLLIAALAAATLSAQEREPAGEDSSSMMWKWANFAILVIGLGYLASKNLPPFFKSRTTEIQQGIAEAQRIKADAERRAAETEARLNALGAEIEKFRQESRAEMEQEAARIREQTKNQAERLRQQAEMEIESATKIARRELQSFAAKLAIDLAEQRIQSRLDKPTDSALIDDFIRDLASSKNQEASKN